MKNKDISDILFAIAEYFTVFDEPFKARAYEKVAETLSTLDSDVRAIYESAGRKALEEIPGIGKGIAQTIEEYIKTGRVRELGAMRKKMPVNMEELRSIEGVGPKAIKTLFEKLKVKDVASLKKAALAGKIQKLEKFGLKSEQKILKGIEFFESSRGRFLLGEALPIARRIADDLRKVKGVSRVEIAGSIRRWRETSGDIDILVEAIDADAVMNAFVSREDVAHIIAHGETKSSVRIKDGIDVDVRVLPKKSFGAALIYFTGSKDHNVILRSLALKRKLKLNEYGLYRGTKIIAGATEEEVYKALGVIMPPPELREGRDELEKKYSELVGFTDLRGDFQTQTDWTDGTGSLEAMVREAKRLGHEYIAITDHTKSLAMTGGSDEKKLRKQMREIDALGKKISGIKILKSAEVNIMKDGTLDISDEVLSELDIVGAAVHSHFNLSEDEQTERIMRAMSNPHVDILFHPTGRVLKKRDPYAVDIDRIIVHAVATGTVLEIDAHPWRLDLKDDHIKRGVDAGAMFSIDTDAHSLAELSYLEYGIGQARRAGLPKNHVLNTLALPALQKFLATPKQKRHLL
ncbi:MAG: DNA polymerase/3'-5' exonuclease PolX [Candidatus Ryanbacteria bacterium]|nr:DNA polymerase/3'-5' exonuclease PolX [Candidatus Ryanbacteria bacterium]